MPTDLKRIVRVKLTSDDIAVMEKTKENGTRDAIMLFSISHLIRKYKTLSCAAIRVCEQYYYRMGLSLLMGVSLWMGVSLLIDGHFLEVPTVLHCVIVW